ncbi:ATP-binding protein [Solirubrobacter soli]|uniref:ATP-binding protein n=1 Tax=Solirubrobacter soli TaxID=363832 RepID=UPI0003F8912F|nr:AAA family ATPase [Solirubrobacter soli]
MVRIRLLGPLGLEVDGVERDLPDRRPGRSLLAWLALHPGTHTRSRVAGTLWPAVLESSARASLRTTLSSVRRALGPAGESALRSTRDTVELSGAWVDALEFESLVTAGRLEAALALCRGDLLADLDDDWALSARETHRSERSDVLRRLAEKAPDAASALAWSRQRVALDPFGEDAHRALMEALSAVGDRAAALAVYERLQDRLRRQLAVAPSIQTRALVASLRTGGSVPAGPLPVALPARRRFVGRAHALDRLRAAWARAQAGEGRLALVTGEPGIGKTQLAAHFAAELHDGGAAVLYGRTEEVAREPFQPFAQSVSASPDRIEAVAAELELAAAAHGLLLILDDLHWADQPTLRLLVELMTRCPPARTLVLATSRQTRAIAPLLRGAIVDELPLGGLDEDELAGLVPGLDRASIARLRSETGGNPFFALQVAEQLRERGTSAPLAVSAGVRQLVAERVSGLGDDTTGLLAAAALIGSAEFELGVLAETQGLAPEDAAAALEAALDAGLLTESPGADGRYAFVHALVRDAIVANLPAPRRTMLHARLAAALEPRAGIDPERHLALLAHHSLAGAVPQAAEFAERAAAAAAALHAHEKAATLLERALETGTAHRRGVLHCALGESLQHTGERGRAHTHFAAATDIARRSGDAELLARAALNGDSASVTVLSVDHQRVERLEEAAALLTPGPLRTRVLARLATELAYDSDAARREAVARQALGEARAAGEPRSLAAALNAQHVTHWGPDHTHARLSWAEEMLDLARQAGDRELALQARNWRLADLFELGDGARLQDELDAYAALAADVALPAFAWYVPMWRATLALLAGRLAEAAELARRGRDLGRAAGDANADAFWREHQHARWLAGERYDAWDAREVAYVEHRIQTSPAGHAFAAGLAFVLAARGLTADAQRTLTKVDLAAVPRDTNWISTMASAGEAAALLGDRERAAAVRTLLEPFAERMVVAARGCFHYGSVAYVLARLDATLGDDTAACIHYEQAITRDEHAGATVWTARDRRHLAQAGVSPC